MELTKAIELIKPGASRYSSKSSWADLGCGTGLFTEALAHFLTKDSIVYAVDKDQKALNNLKTLNNVQLQKLVADFRTDELPLSKLDGILMANSLHFVRDKVSFIQKSIKWLNENGCFLLVEYDSDTENPWVPYPLNFSSAEKLFKQSGFTKIQKLGLLPSLYNRSGIYAALIER